MKKTILIFLFAFLAEFCFFSCNTTTAKSAKHRIEVEISNWKPDAEKTYFLARYFGDSHYKQDSSKLLVPNKLVFEGDSTIRESYYKILLDDSTFVEIIVGEDQEFSVKLDYTNIVNSISFSGSEENKKLYDYFSLLEEKRKDFEAHSKNLKTDEDKEKKFKEQNQEINTWRSDYVNKNPNKLLAYTFKALNEPLLNFGEETDIEKRRSAYDAYLKKYLSSIDFSDDRTYAIPAIVSKVNNYLDNLVTNLAPEKLTGKLFELIDLNASNEDNKRWIISHCLNKYQRGKFMFSEDIYADLVLKYINKKNMPWLDEAELYRFQDKANALRKIKLGIPAPAFLLHDLDSASVNLYSIEAKSTIVIFYNPTCEHCKDIAPKIRKFYDENNDLYDFKIVAINVGNEPEEWKPFIDKFKFSPFVNLADFENKTGIRSDYYISSVPKSFILDDKKNIIAKNFSTERIAEVYKRIVLQESN